MVEEAQRERIRRVGVVFALVLLGFLLYRVVAPFLAALAWAVILTLALWPLFRRLSTRFPSPPWLAPAAMSSLISIGILGPLLLLGLMLVGEAKTLADDLRGTVTGERGDLVGTLRAIPGVGDGLADGLLRWRDDPQDLEQVLAQNTERMVGFATRVMTNVGRNVFKIVVCIFTTYFLFLYGDSLRVQIRSGVARLGGPRAEDLLARIRETVRAVVYGLVMTAIVQAVLTSLGFWVAGHPYPLVLGALMFVFSFIPLGPPLIWGPASISLFLNDEVGWGIATFVWGAAVVSSVDNVLRPLFIGHATKMPVLLIFIGVIGGVMAFGMVGLFVGPVVIAVALALWREWVARRDETDGPATLDGV